MMTSPPKLRPSSPTQKQPNGKKHRYSIPHPPGITNPQPTPQRNLFRGPTQPITMEATTNIPADRISIIEREMALQQERNDSFDNRIKGLELTTSRIDTNVSTILDKLDSFHLETPSKQRNIASSQHNTADDVMLDVESHPDPRLTRHSTGCLMP
jgi:hypothetical protein